jgi:hypothetical protein
MSRRSNKNRQRRRTSHLDAAAELLPAKMFRTPAAHHRDNATFLFTQQPYFCRVTGETALRPAAGLTKSITVLESLKL